LVRIGVGPIATGIAAFATGFISYWWLTLDTEPARASVRAGPRVLADSSMTQPKFVDTGAAVVGSLGQEGHRATSASLGEDEPEWTFKQPDHRSEPPSAARMAFVERFSLDQPSRPSTSFGDRFFSEIPPSSAPLPSVAAASSTTLRRVSAAAPAPRPIVSSRVAQATPKRPSEPGFQLASAFETIVALAYAPNPSAKDSGSALKEFMPKAPNPLGDIDTSRTAIYDITSKTVYLPNGRSMEAHSGLGSYMDDPHYVNMKDTGPTPPNVYELKLRESPFHGDRAIRLIPADDSKMFGRDGILAHSYLLGPNGQSNGCVSFKDYAAFLDAFERGEVNRLVVVERLADAPSPKTASDWLANTLKDFFRRS